MNSLALVIVGLILGAAFILMACATAALLWAVHLQRQETAKASESVTKLIRENTQSMKDFRKDMGLAMSKMDADRMFEASVNIQRTAQSLRKSSAELQKAVYREPIQQGLEFSPEIPEDEPVDGFGNPLDQLSPEERNERVQEYFRRRATERPNGIRKISDTPPTPMSGVYAEMMKGLQQNPPAPKPLEDFPEEHSGLFSGENQEN